MPDFNMREELILNAKRANAACILLRRPACLRDGDTCYFFAPDDKGVLTIREGVKTVELLEPWVREIDRFIIPCTLESIEDTDAWEEFNDACLLNSSSKFDLEVEMHSRSESVINKMLEAGVFFDFSSSVCVDIFRTAGKSLNDEMNVDLYYCSYLNDLIENYVNNSTFTNSSSVSGLAEYTEGLDEYTEALNVFIQEACKGFFNVFGIKQETKTYTLEDFGMYVSEEHDRLIEENRLQDMILNEDIESSDEVDSIDNLKWVSNLKKEFREHTSLGGRVYSVLETVSSAASALDADGLPFYDKTHGKTVELMRALQDFCDSLADIYVGSFYDSLTDICDGGLHSYVVEELGVSTDKLNELNGCFREEFDFGLGKYLGDED